MSTATTTAAAIAVDEDNSTIINPQQFQSDELELLQSIYSDEFQWINSNNKHFTITISPTASIDIQLPIDYPLNESKPIINLSALKLSNIELLESKLADIIVINTGTAVLYQCIECIREYYTSIIDNNNTINSDRELATSSLQAAEDNNNNTNNTINSTISAVQLFPIITGPTITDRKSIFQSHLILNLNSIDQIELALTQLKSSNNRINRATHNIYAYRLLTTNNTVILTGNSDDGELHAGSRLSHLLSILLSSNNCTVSVLVIVSRWFGGIELGADRFKHINNVARELLLQQGLVTNNNTNTVKQSNNKSNKNRIK